MRNTRIVAAVVVGLLAGTAVGQEDAWTVMNLDPTPQPMFSLLLGGDPEEQVGVSWYNAIGGQQPHAMVWHGTAESAVDLLPPGTRSAWAFCAAGGRQGGSVQLVPGARSRAALWSGTSAWVDLTPPGATEAVVSGMWGQVQVGMATMSGRDHAALWHGTAGSFEDLNPAWAYSSTLTGVWEDRQTGNATPEGGWWQAGVWSGTAGSYVSLHPPGFLKSTARGVWGEEQAGYVDTGATTYAALWRGTMESFVNLNPAGSSRSQALGVCEGVQVGNAFFPSGLGGGAGIWRGTAGSWVNLQRYVPARIVSTTAYAIWRGGGFLYVGGSGRNGSGGTEALLWRLRLGPLVCNVDFNGDGFVDFFDYDAFVACFEGASCPPGTTADFDADGFTDAADYAGFVRAYQSGV